jgi:5-aminolevulinate synthase
MGQHPKVTAAMQEAINLAGAGSGGTRNISGTHHFHVELEKELADLHGKEAGLLFTSGYVPNDATLSTLARMLPGSISFSHDMNHASMIEGMRHQVRKTHLSHNDGASGRTVASAPNAPKIVCFERLFDGRRFRQVQESAISPNVAR